jgi:hypothetical protein
MLGATTISTSMVDMITLNGRVIFISTGHLQILAIAMSDFLVKLI